jgi:hypothetical protein
MTNKKIMRDSNSIVNFALKTGNSNDYKLKPEHPEIESNMRRKIASFSKLVSAFNKFIYSNHDEATVKEFREN